jgi:hypothetical protein
MLDVIILNCQSGSDWNHILSMDNLYHLFCAVARQYERTQMKGTEKVNALNAVDIIINILSNAIYHNGQGTCLMV